MKKRRISWGLMLYLLIAVVLLLWLAVSNDVIVKIAGQDIEETVMSDYQSTPGLIRYAVDEFNEQGNILEQVTFNGWAYHVSEHPNFDRKVYLIFKSIDAAYVVETDLKERTDLKELAEQDFGEERSKTLGYGTVFSTVRMKDGVYELYFYCWENEQDYGLINTGKYYRKNGSVFEETEWESLELQDVPEAPLSGYGHLDSVSQESGYLSMSGWAYLEEVDAQGQEAYILLEQDGGIAQCFTTQRYQRMDIGESCGERYEQSGVKARIPLDELDGEYMVSILLQSEDAAGCISCGKILIENGSLVSVS